MGMVNGIRIVNQVIAGTLSGSALQTYLGTAANRASWIHALNTKTLSRALAESSTAMTAIGASALASTDVAASSVALAAVMGNVSAYTAAHASSNFMNAVAASSYAAPLWVANTTIMTAAVNSSTAMTSLGSYVPSKMEMFRSDTVLGLIVASSTALTALRGCAGYAVYNATHNNGSDVTITGPNAAGSYIVLGASKNNVETTYTLYDIKTKRSGSAVVSTNLNWAGTGSASTTPTQKAYAIPVVSPFSTSGDTTGAASQYYFGFLRCDV